MVLPEIAPFYLVGGTALALQIGHRVSVDLDLFTPQPFDKNELLEALGAEFEVSVESESGNMLITYINDVKVDFVKMSYPLLFSPLNVEGIRMLEVRDIAPMKLKAVTQQKVFLRHVFFARPHALEGYVGLVSGKIQAGNHIPCPQKPDVL